MASNARMRPYIAGLKCRPTGASAIGAVSRLSQRSVVFVRRPSRRSMRWRVAAPRKFSTRIRSRRHGGAGLLQRDELARAIVETLGDEEGRGEETLQLAGARDEQALVWGPYCATESAGALDNFAVFPPTPIAHDGPRTEVRHARVTD